MTALNIYWLCGGRENLFSPFSKNRNLGQPRISKNSVLQSSAFGFQLRIEYLKKSQVVHDDLSYSIPMNLNML